MIRHRPRGLEHPYATTFDQRVPADPSDGDELRLGVRAATHVVAVTCDLVTGEGPTTTHLALTPVDASAATVSAATVGGGHLAAIQERGISARGAWTVTVGTVRAGTTYRYRFRATAADGRSRSTRWFTFAPGRWADHGGRLVVDGTDRVIPGSVSWWDDGSGPRRVRLALPLVAGEHVVGFGERFDHLDQRGRSLDATVFEQYKDQAATGRTYLPMPFAHVVGATTPGWGFFLRTTARSWYDVGRTDPDRLVIEAEVDPDDPVIELVVRDGDPRSVLGAFLDEVGRAEELPDWVFRLWASDNEWNNQNAVLREVDRHREEGIDVGVVVIEAWSDEQTFAAFRDAQYKPTTGWHPHHLADFSYPADGAWPDPGGMVQALRERDCHVILWQIPLIKMRPPPRGQAALDAVHAVDANLVVAGSDGRPYRNRGAWFHEALMPDLRDPQVAQAWTERLRYLVTEVGVDGFKTDGGEHAWGRSLRYRDGRRGWEANNTFPVAYSRAFGDLLRSAGKAPVTFSRAGFAGSQRTGIIWAGDENSTWEAMRASLTAGLTAAACGVVYWSWDLAGFSGPVPDPDLYLRAAAVSTFLPVMQYHAEFNFHRATSRARTPWNVAETWGDDRVVPAFRELVRLRRRLVPYLLDQARLACLTDRPLLRPLFFDHPSDPEIWDWPLEFTLGDDLLVCPVTSPGVEEWPCFLPAGRWVDAWTGHSHDGRHAFTAPAPPGRVPVFVRESAWQGLRAAFEAVSP